MATSNDVVVRGTDGERPTYDPKGLHWIWDKSKLYDGPGDIGAGKYVGNILDYAVDKIIHKWYQIIDIDWATLKPTYRALDAEETNGVQSILVGLGVQPKTKLAFYDTSKLPYELSLDSRNYVNGSENMYARFFRGTDISAAGEVISAVFNGQTYVDDKIPLEMVKYDSHDITVLAQKTVPTINTKANLKTGEIITVVVYNTKNMMTYMEQFKVVNSSTVRAPNSSQKLITGIALESIFLNGNDPYVIDFPLNAPIGALNAWGIITYSDKTTKRLEIDGSKFALHGLEKFVATRPGQQVPISLTYRLDPGEYATTVISADGKRIVENYHVVTTTENGLFSPMLFGYPRWDDAASTYVMRWWLMDLNRKTLFDASNYVQYNQSSDIFNGSKFDAMQFLSIRVRLSEVSDSLPAWNHTQTLYVKLFNPLTQVRPQGKWEVSQENVDGTFYGKDLVARVNTINQNNFEIKLDNNINTLDKWLDELYYKSRPVYATYKESEPPMPTHFTVLNDMNNVQTFPIANWNRAFKVFTNLQAKGNLVIRWDEQLANGTVLQLATTELPMDFIS
jgi:hypothetical protein